VVEQPSAHRPAAENDDLRFICPVRHWDHILTLVLRGS
jgi:hypothetical protein